MKDAKAVEPSDIKKAIAEYFNVPEANVIKAQYTYFVILEEKHEG